MGDRSLFHSLDASRSERPIWARSLPVDMACVGGTVGLPFLNHRDMSGGGAGGAAATPSVESDGFVEFLILLDIVLTRSGA